MRFLLFLFLGFSSCSATKNNSGGLAQEQQPEIEISFLNSDANFRAVIDAASKIGSVSAVRYPVGNLSQPINVLSVNCYSASKYAFTQFKSYLGSCRGVVGIYDTSMK